MRPGDVVGGRFQLVRLAAAGGMGEIHEALDRESGQRVAIKVFGGRHGDDAARLAREARVLSDLDHPQIVRYLGHGELPWGEPWLAMEWLDGEHLGARLSRGRLHAAESIALARRVAEALGHAHARGVVHRDLKPSNLFLPAGKIEAVKILDFGIAQRRAVPRITQAGVLVGTPGYMAPEQARSEERVDARADVFSLGCVLFECLTGERAFPGAHVMAVLARILFEAPARLRVLRPELPEALEALLDRMLAKDPEDRPHDGQAVAEALWALEDPPSSGPGGPSSAGAGRKALTGSEQRAVAVILLGAPGDVEALPARDEAPLRREAEQHGGRFERLLDGSAVVMLSGPRLATDLAAQAARCALALRAHAGGAPIALALGRAEATGSLLMGPAIDRAVRLVAGPPAGAPESGPVALDEIAAGLLDARFDVREHEAGFVLHGERDLAEGTRTLLGKATPCVGRDWELRVLEQGFDDCVAEGASRAMLVTAPAGGGKSRLAQELRRRLRERDEEIAIWIGRGDPLRAGSAFGLLGQAIRGACGIRDGEPIDVRRSKLLARVAEHVAPGDRARVAELLGEIIGAPFPDDDNLPLRAARRDAQLMNAQMRAAFLDFLAAECAAHPVLILLEDLHWGDRPTVQLLDRALRELHDRPFLVLALARPEIGEAFPDLWGARGIEEVRLRPLGRKAIERLARHVLGEVAGREAVDRLARLSEGNAFYLEELIRREAEGPGAELPETAVAMVQSRLGGLDEDARRLLRAASVFGEVFWVGGVVALLGAERAERVPERLAELVDREIVVARGEGRFPGEDEYAFRHALLREGARAMLTDEDHALGHQLAGEWLEQHGEQDTLVLADHFERGGDRERAGQCYLRATELALAAGDATAAEAHIRRALAGAVPWALRTRLLGTLCEAACWHLEALDAALPLAEELVRIAEPGSVPWVQGMFAKLSGAMQGGRFAEILETLRIVRETEITPDAAPTLALVFAGSIYFLDVAGQLAESQALQDRLAALAAAVGDREPSVPILWRCSCALRDAYARRDPAGALADAGAAVRLAAAIRHTRYLGVAQLFQGKNLFHLGAFAAAERTLQDLSVVDDEISYGAPIRLFCLAWLLADCGQLAEARAHARGLVALGGARGVPLGEALGRWVLAEVHRRAGDLAAADQEIGAALATLGMVSPIDHPGALATLAALRLAQGRPAEALAAVEDGLSRARAVGTCSYFFRAAFLRLTHVECLEATGAHAAARAAIAEARDELLALAGKIEDAEHRRSFLEAVPENRRTFELARAWLDPA